jgi:hypothetical protein
MRATTTHIAELEKYKAILLATIDYEVVRVSSIYKADELVMIQDSFSIMKERIEKHYVTEGLAAIKKALRQFTMLLHLQGDLIYSPYIKATTGYDVDLFANITKKIDQILERNAIKNRQELQDVIAMIALCRQTSAYAYDVAHLKNIMFDYQRLNSKKLLQQEHQILQLAEISSPDFLHYIEVYEANNTDTQIQVTQRFGGKSFGFFSANGINLA